MWVIYEIIGHIVFGLIAVVFDEAERGSPLAKILAFAIIVAFFIALVALVVWVKNVLAYV